MTVPRHPATALTATLAATLAAALAFAGPAAADDASLQALAGSWTLNPGLSDAPPQGPPPGGGPDGSGGAPPPPPPDGGGPGGPGGPRGGRGGPARALVIAVSGTTVTITPDGRDARSLAVGGAPVERQRGPMTVTESAAFSGGALVVTTTVPDRPAMTESFALATDGSGRLWVSRQLPARGTGEARTVKQVYDRTK